MTSFSVTSIKKVILEFQEDSPQFPTHQRSDSDWEEGKTACNRQDARATSSERGLNKETREERYRRRLQFSVRTLSATV
jgi:hypothetical protein